MAELRSKWPLDAFDAVRISGIDGQFTIEASDGNEVELEGDVGGKWNRGSKLEPANRWLSLPLWGHHGGDVTLRLPRSKSWVVDVLAARGQVEASDVQARLSISLGKGDIQVENCQGQLALAAGKGDIKIEGCQEKEMPERPPIPERDQEMAGGPIPPLPPIPEGAGAFFDFRHGPRVRFKTRAGDYEDWGNWEDWNGEEWARWGEEIGERAAAWAEGFVSQFAGRMDWLTAKGGIGIKLGQGDVEMDDVTAKTCAVRMGSGDVKIDGGRIENLNVEASRGDIECKDVLPQGSWSIEMRHGDIKLKLPRETRARLDVSTRHGDIDSEVPLVRVGRPGRESRHGGRMVGTAGAADGQAPEIRVSALHGDIEIKGPRGEYSRAERPAEASPAAPQAAPRPAPAPAPSPQASDIPSSSESKEDRPAAPYDSQMAILQALAEGQISVAEAEKLLKSLER